MNQLDRQIKRTYRKAEKHFKTTNHYFVKHAPEETIPKFLLIECKNCDWVSGYFLDRKIIVNNVHKSWPKEKGD